MTDIYCYADLLPLIREQHKAGESYASIADVLHRQEHTTDIGKQFSATTVYPLLAYSLREFTD